MDEVINQMEKLPVIDGCYQSWWELQCRIENFYSEKDRQRSPLSEQKEFRSIKNAVIQEAENIRLGRITFEDEPTEQPTPNLSELPYDCWELWILTQDDTAPLAERDEAAAQLISMAEGGDLHAQYLTGKLYLDGPVLIPDWLTAGYWFDLAARQGYAAAQYESSWESCYSPMIRKSAIRHWGYSGWNARPTEGMATPPIGWGKNTSRVRS